MILFAVMNTVKVVSSAKEKYQSVSSNLRTIKGIKEN
jgi:hypothetical protein